MHLLIIRHGETPLNVARVLQPPDTPLSLRGQAQARALAARLQAWQGGGQPLAGIVSSDLPRALQTAEAVARATGLALQTTALLQERNFGELRGQRYDSLGYDPLLAEHAPPGGESQAQFRARCAQAWTWVLAQQSLLGGPLAVVSHGLVIREWLQRGPLSLPAGWASPQSIANTSLTVASAAPPHTISLLDCSAHLDSGVGEDKQALSGG